MSNATLMNIVQAANQVEQMLVAAGGEVTPEIEELLADVEKSLSTKIDGYHAIMGKVESTAEYFKKRADEFNAASKSLTNFQVRLKDRIKAAMVHMNVTTIEGDDVKFTLSRTKPAMVVESVDLLPEGYKMIVQGVVVDKEKLHEALQMGVTVPGAELRESVAFRATVNKKVKS